MGTYGPRPTSAPAGAIILHAGDNVSAIVNAAPVGATFYFEPGIYRSVSITPKDGQTFIGAEGAILNGSAVLTDWSQSGSTWVIGGQTQQGVRHATDQAAPGAQRAGYPETVFVDNVPLKPVDALSKVTVGTFYFDYNADKIYLGSDPTGHTVEAGKLAYAFHGSAQNVTIENLTIEKYDPPSQDGAIEGTNGSNWTIQNNEVRLNYAVGIHADNAPGTQMLNNYVHDNGEMGLGGSGNNILVQGNEIARNGGWAGLDPLWEGGGFKFGFTDGLTIRNNYSHDNIGDGMWTDTDAIHVLYENNVVMNNSGPGIQHEISYDAIIRNNTVIGNGFGDPRGWMFGAQIQIQNSPNVDVYDNRVDMTGANGITLIQGNRGSGPYGPYVITNDHVHDNIIVSRDATGVVGGDADTNLSGMLNGGNTWDNNQFYMTDYSGRFVWGNDYNFAGFESHTSGNGDTISQNYPNTDAWLTDVLPPADTDPPPPADTDPPPPADTDPPPPADTDPLPEDLVLIGGRGSDHLDGGDGNDQLYGRGGNDILVGHAGNDVINGESGRDILMGGPGNDVINGNSGKDYLLLDGTMQDYSFVVSRGGVTMANSAGEVDTVKNVEVFHFSDGTNYLVGRHGLVQTDDQSINKFLADSGADQSYFSAVPAAGTQQQLVQAAASDLGTGAPDPVVPQQDSSTPNASADNTGTGTTLTSLGMSPHTHGPLGGSNDQLTIIFGQALNQTGHPQGANKVLGNTAPWSAVDAASNNPTYADSALADLKQQLHDAFEHDGANVTTDELAALLHWTHHE
jgi:parallel beta-helix repeat protein